MRILVVDDEKLLVKGVKFNLENEGYEVECAYDGASAVELARNCLLYTSPSPRDGATSRMPSSA